MRFWKPSCIWSRLPKARRTRRCGLSFSIPGSTRIAASSSWCGWWTAVCARGRRSGCGRTARSTKWRLWDTRRLRPRRATNWRRARWGSSRPPSRRFPTPRSATPSPTTKTRPPRRCPASKRSSRWSSRVSTRWNRTSTACCATRSKNCASTTAPSTSSRRIRWRWASASVASSCGVQERLEREFDIDLITTAPGVRYRIVTTTGATIEVDNPTKFPDPSGIKQIEEPIIDATVITREDFLGGVLKLLEEKRGIQKKFEYIAGGRVMLLYELPLNEIVLDFYDRLKSSSRGYASLDYHLAGYRVSPMVRLDVLVAGEPVDALSIIVHKEFAFERGKGLISRLRKLIPRQMFEVARAETRWREPASTARRRSPASS